MIADRATQHRILVLQLIEQRFHCCRPVKIDMYLIANLCQRAQMMGKNDADHRSHVSQLPQRTPGVKGWWVNFDCIHHAARPAVMIQGASANSCTSGSLM